MGGERWRVIRYRVRQFILAVTARVSPADRGIVAELLPPAAQQLFARQSAADQRHALAVCQMLRTQGETDADLLAAALLHDIGKAAGRLSPAHRAVVVLLERLAPSVLALLSRAEPPTGQPQAWRRPFVRHAQHAAAGAQAAGQAGCSAATVRLIERHHEAVSSANPEDQLLERLQHADSLN